MGCESDCSGPLPEYTCSGGNLTHPDVCTPICGDGKVVPGELCDDGSDDGNGCEIGC